MASAHAADKYPSRPVPAGGPNDTIANIFAEWLSGHLGQQFVVEDRAARAA